MKIQLPQSDDIYRSVRQALEEDIGSGDLSAMLIPEHAQTQASIICREEAVLCGSAWFNEVFRQLDDEDWSIVRLSP